ncbi:hypothetical protein ACHAPT_012805 [Fusarium lateritium]
MAEAFTIIGLTSSIITFIEFGIRITRAARSIRVAADGKAPEIQELEKNLDEIHARNQRILERKAAGRLSKDEARIADTVEEYAKYQLFETGRITVKMAVGRGELESLQKRLMEQDSKIRESLKALLESDRQSELLKELNKIHKLHVRHEINQNTNFAMLQQQIIDISSHLDNNLATFEAQVTSLRTKLEKLDQEAERQRREAQVIESLYFRNLQKRCEDIKTADSSTNSWLYESRRTSFSSWLESDTRDIFCISGLAGSGKSTLMKYAFDHPLTRAGLGKWAKRGTGKGDSPEPLDLCRTSYYFWNQGFPLQKSQIGLLRSLLYQILRHVPSLVSLVDPNRLHHEEWEFGELMSLCDSIMNEPSLSTRFCFFIDGLDEYNGDEADVAKLITAISRSPHVKVCASSRPRLIFDKNL